MLVRWASITDDHGGNVANEDRQMTYSIKETRTGKGRDGWETKTKIDFDDVLTVRDKVGRRRLTLSTYKRNRDLVTLASVSFVNDGFESFMLFADYSKTVIKQPCARVTEKDVKRQHEEALALIPAIVGEVDAFYAAKAAEAA
jgi:hypothetical protein